MEILYEDAALIVAVKPGGTVSENTPSGDGFADLLAARCGGYIGTVHRLDRGVGGVMAYAKTPAAAARLSAAIQDRTLKKEYLAVVHGTPSPAGGELRDLLFHDRMKNKTFVVDRARRGVKEAILDFEVLRSVQNDGEAYSLLRIRLQTGRTHQIRVQFSSRGHALLGDGKYGSRERSPLGLFCTRLEIPHPITGKTLTVEALPQGSPWEIFGKALS
ncbi:MAG: RluA family pseudouridine synthase [Clostridia bacterium]|nr:RluA family pseudouridine synthase [Clostridia bacterium]